MRELYMIPEREHLAESLQLSAETGAYFEYNDFFSPRVLDDPAETERIVSLYRAQPRDRSRDLLHGAFLDVTVHSEDAQIRRVSALRVHQSMEIAEALGVRGVVFHTNFIPNFRQNAYQTHWLEENARFWRTVLAEYPHKEILLENMFDETPAMLCALAEAMRAEDRFGVCLDYAHAAVFGGADRLAEWTKTLLPYTRHMHINDNDLQSDLHQAVGAGQIRWADFDRYMRAGDASCSVLVEVRGTEAARASLDFLRKHAIFPFDTEA